MTKIKATYIDHMGTDERVVSAARGSFGNFGSKELSKKDIGLIKFLARGVPLDEWNNMIDRLVKSTDHKEVSGIVKYIRTIPIHFIPDTHCQITLIEEVPLFVARQRFKHRIGFSESEISRRYITDNIEIFEPEEWRAKPEGSIKQGSSDKTVDLDDFLVSNVDIYEDSGEFKGTNLIKDYEGMSEDDREYYKKIDVYNNSVNTSVESYHNMLESGVAPEQARMVLPQSMMVRYMVTGSLYAFAKAYIQRSDSHAQKEIQLLAEQWDKIIRPLYPISWAALVDGDYD